MKNWKSHLVVFGGIYLLIAAVIINLLIDYLSMTALIIVICIFPLIFFAWRAWLKRNVKATSSKYAHDEKTGYVIGLTCRDVAKGLDNKMLLIAICRLGICKKIMPFIGAVSIFVLAYGFKIDYELLWGPGIALSIVSIGMWIHAWRILPIYNAEKAKRKL